MCGVSSDSTLFFKFIGHGCTELLLMIIVVFVYFCLQYDICSNV